MTFGELSDIFRVSEKRTWQIGQKALRKLRHPSRSRFLLGRAGLTAPMWSPVRTARPHTVIPPPRVLRPDLPLRDRLFLEVRDLELSVRLANCLDAAEVRFIGDLVQKSEAELLRTKNFGRKSLREVSELLAVLDLSLGTKVRGWARTRAATLARQQRPPESAHQRLGRKTLREIKALLVGSGAPSA